MRFLAVALCSLAVLAPATGEAKTRKKAHKHHVHKNYGNSHSGMASWYGHTGNRTANGERTNLGGLTAAHRTLPMGTRVRVTNTRNGRSVVVRINDRGPFIRGRVIDLTPAGARAIGMSGLAPVSLSVVN
nr:septal ring lytic transglycosylase RlpA family protein [Variibacter gotjawalensis]